MIMNKVVVCGGRNYNDALRFCDFMNDLHEKNPIDVIIQGGAAGADFMANLWGEIMSLEVITVNADWNQYGKAAGMIRNKKMLEYNPNLVIAFPGGKGTQNMVTLARKAKIEVLEVT